MKLFISLKTIWSQIEEARMDGIQVGILLTEPLPLEWSDYDRFWRPNLREDVWQYNMNVLGHTDSVGIESIIDHCFAFDKNVGMRLIGCLICQVYK